MNEQRNSKSKVNQPTRHIRCKCQSCDWIGDDSEILCAPSPFDAEDTIYGCPNCGAVDGIVNACDEPGCNRNATCGWPSPDGYRRTCGKHMQYKKHENY